MQFTDKRITKQSGHRYDDKKGDEMILFDVNGITATAPRFIHTN